MSLLFNTHPLVINPQLAEKIGLNEAIVLQQMHYWLGKETVGFVRNGKRWFYSSYNNWIKQFPFWSESTIKRIISNLKDQGFIEVEQFNRHKHDRTNYYSICYERLGQCDQYDKVNVTPSTVSNRDALTETTAENTSKTTTDSLMSSSANIDPPAKKQSANNHHTEAAKQLLEYLNTQANRKFRGTAANIKLITSRLKEGYSPDDVARVIERKCLEWIGDRKMEQYLRPSTLFNATKFNNYAGQIDTPLPTSTPNNKPYTGMSEDDLSWMQGMEDML